MAWPRQSLDLNNIDTVWDHLEREQAANIQIRAFNVHQEVRRTIPKDQIMAFKLGGID